MGVGLIWGLFCCGEEFWTYFMPVGSRTLCFLTLKCCKCATVAHKEQESIARRKLLSDSQTSDNENME